MMHIGFIDYYLDNWHAANYPAWIRETARRRGWDMDLCFAWAKTERTGGMTTQAWCQAHEVEPVDSAQELVERSDAMIILSPNNPEQHEDISRIALASGKPVYMDKTFAPDVDAARRMFTLAAQHGTPFFSTSALRFARELAPWRDGTYARPDFCATTGSGSYEVYAIHQLEMILVAMGRGARRVKLFPQGVSRTMVIDYGDRTAVMTQSPSAEFMLWSSDAEGVAHTTGPCSAFFETLMEVTLDYFATRRVPVNPLDTMEIIALRQAGFAALARPDTWVDVPDCSL